MEPERQFKFNIQAYLSKNLERNQGVKQLLPEQMDREAGAMGISYFNFFWAYNLLQPALPRMPERAQGLYQANGHASERFF